MKTLAFAIALGMAPMNAGAADIVDGAVCAHLAYQIESLGVKNDAQLEEIAQAQIAQASGKSYAGPSSASLTEGRKALVALRGVWIADYEAKCSAMSLSVNDLKRICKPSPGVAPLRETVFCKPAREAGL
jgi:hypothetical protein